MPVPVSSVRDDNRCAASTWIVRTECGAAPPPAVTLTSSSAAVAGAGAASASADTGGAIGSAQRACSGVWPALSTRPTDAPALSSAVASGASSAAAAR